MKALLMIAAFLPLFVYAADASDAKAKAMFNAMLEQSMSDNSVQRSDTISPMTNTSKTVLVATVNGQTIACSKEVIADDQDSASYFCM